MNYSVDREPHKKSLEGYYSNDRRRFTDRGFIDHSTSAGPTFQYEWAIDPEAPDDFDDDKRLSRNRICQLVRKLKCGKVTSKERKQRQLGMDMNHKQWHDGILDERWGLHHQQNNPTSRYSRNVNITVERGDAPRPSIDYPRRQQQSSFSEFGGTSIRPVRGRIPDGHLPNNYFSPIILMDQQSPPKVGVDSISEQKERWLKLIQQGWSDNRHDDPIAHSSGSGDYSPTHGLSSRPCDCGTSNSGDTEYTTESDETDPSNPRRPAPRQVHKVSNQTDRRVGSSNQKRQINLGSNNDLWEGLAEDFGIFVGLLLADGSACVGTISDITRETVADSCNSNDVPASDLDNFYSMDVRGHSLLGNDD